MRTTVLHSLRLIAALTICFFWSGCATDEDHSIAEPTDRPALLEITAGIHTQHMLSRSWSITEFTQGSALGLFLTKGSLGDDYSPAGSRNVRSAFSGQAWIQYPSVNLFAHSATVYAYYPYHANNSFADGTSIPVSGGVTDYMYGTHTPGQGAVNKENRTVHLTMNHALALLQFELFKQDYPWEGKLTTIRIANAKGKAVVHLNARMNISTGEITELQDADMELLRYNAMLGTIPYIDAEDDACLQELLVVPTGKTQAEGDVLVTFTIDSKEYVWPVPAQTEWKQGTRNTYRVVLQGNAMQLASVSVSKWTDGLFGSVILE